MGRALAVIIWILTLGSVSLFFVKKWWFPTSISEHAPALDRQFMLTIIVVGLAFTAAQIGLGYMVWKFRDTGTRERANGAGHGCGCSRSGCESDKSPCTDPVLGKGKVARSCVGQACRKRDRRVDHRRVRRRNDRCRHDGWNGLVDIYTRDRQRDGVPCMIGTHKGSRLPCSFGADRFR